MKKLLFAAALAVSHTGFAATIALWTFETSQPNAANQAVITGILPEIGSGSASGVHASAATDYSNPAGNGSAESFSANEWAVGDYFEFSLSTVGYQGISVSYDQTSSSTGPALFDFAYSTDGVSYTTFATGYTVLANGSFGNWNSTTSTNAYSYSWDLSSISDLDNATTVHFRIVDASTTSAGGGTVGTGGTDRLDNVLVSGSVIPEPQSMALFGIAALLLTFVRRRSS